MTTETQANLTDNDWMLLLLQDAAKSLIHSREVGDTVRANNALADIYLTLQAYLKGDEHAVWAYLFDYAGDEAHAIIEAEEAKEKEAAT